MGTPLWKAKVNQISRSEFGSSVANMYAYFKYVDDDDDEDDIANEFRSIQGPAVLAAASASALPDIRFAAVISPDTVSEDSLALNNVSVENIATSQRCTSTKVTNAVNKRKACASTFQFLKVPCLDSNANATTVPRKVKLKCTLLNDKGKIRPEVVKSLTESLGKRKTLREDEEKLLGALLDIQYQDEKVGNNVNAVTVRGKGRGRPRHLLLVNQNYNRGAGVTARTKRTDAAKVKEAMQIFDPSGTYTESYVSQYVKDNPALMKKFVSVYMMANRLPPAQSIVIQAYCKFNQNQTKRLERSMSFDHGFRVFATANKTAEFKNTHLADNNKTLTHTVIVMSRKINAGGKKTTRDVPVLVTTQSPAELVLRQLMYVFGAGIFLPSEIVFRAPFWFEGFDDAALFKISGDAGNSSFKAILNIVNVLNPQGLEHVRLFLEFSGVKDTYENVVATAFKDGSPVKFEIEAICQRRLSAAKISMNNEMQMVVTINTDENHDHKRPKPLPKLLLGVTSEQASMTDKNKMGIISIDVSTVGFIQVCCDSVTETALGLSFFGFDASCIGTAYFPNPIERNASTDSGSIRLSQIVVAGLFVADIDFMSTFLGHSDLKVENPSSP